MTDNQLNFHIKFGLFANIKGNARNTFTTLILQTLTFDTSQN